MFTLMSLLVQVLLFGLYITVGFVLSNWYEPLVTVIILPALSITSVFIFVVPSFDIVTLALVPVPFIQFPQVAPLSVDIAYFHDLTPLKLSATDMFTPISLLIQVLLFGLYVTVGFVLSIFITNSLLNVFPTLSVATIL